MIVIFRYLNNNQLCGKIPKEIGKLKCLEIMYSKFGKVFFIITYNKK